MRTEKESFMVEAALGHGFKIADDDGTDFTCKEENILSLLKAATETITIRAGQEVELGWNGAKYFSEHLAYQSVRVEAVGVDWIVIRDSNGRPHATGFSPQEGHGNILQELKS